MICIYFIKFFITGEDTFMLDSYNELSKIFNCLLKMFLFYIDIVLIPDNVFLQGMESIFDWLSFDHFYVMILLFR